MFLVTDGGSLELHDLHLLNQETTRDQGGGAFVNVRGAGSHVHASGCQLHNGVTMGVGGHVFVHDGATAHLTGCNASVGFAQRVRAPLPATRPGHSHPRSRLPLTCSCAEWRLHWGEGRGRRDDRAVLVQPHRTERRVSPGGRHRTYGRLRALPSGLAPPTENE